MHGRGVVVGLALSLVIGGGAWARVPLWPAAELNHLLGPIALYPDPVLAQILPAATAPDDLALAVKFLEDGGDLDQVDAQPWNDNAKALARWPEILRMMNRSRDWTEALGAAFLDQPKDVMNSIQRLRAVAMTSSALETTDEQRVTAEDGIIYVYPSDPSVIHLPQYDAEKVFALLASTGGNGMVTFGSALLVGYWVHHELDWRKHWVYSYDYREYPYGRRNPWYFGGQVAGQVPPNLPEQDNGKWKPDKKKRRPHANLGEPVPTAQIVAAPPPVVRGNAPAQPEAESRPLAPPKDLPLPPPMLTPVDPEMEPLEEQPAKKPAKPATVSKKPAAAKSAPARTDKIKPASTKPIPAKAGKVKPAEAKTSSAKAVKEKPAPRTTAKAKPPEKQLSSAKAVKATPKGQKPVPAKAVKAKPAEKKPSTKK